MWVAGEALEDLYQFSALSRCVVNESPARKIAGETQEPTSTNPDVEDRAQRFRHVHTGWFANVIMNGSEVAASALNCFADIPEVPPSTSRASLLVGADAVSSPSRL